MGRRFEKPAGLKSGLLEKYQQCQGNSNLRWEMLKAFMCDKDMNLDCVCFSLCFVPCHILRCKMHEFYNNFMCDFNWLEVEERSWSWSWVHSACHSSRINCFASMCVSDPSFHFLPNLTAHWMHFRLAESSRHEIYEELPLFEIEQKWGGTEAGKNLAGTYLPSSFSSCSFLLFGFSVCMLHHPRAYIEKIKASLQSSYQKVLRWCCSHRPIFQ